MCRMKLSISALLGSEASAALPLVLPDGDVVVEVLDVFPVEDLFIDPVVGSCAVNRFAQASSKTASQIIFLGISMLPFFYLPLVGKALYLVLRRYGKSSAYSEGFLGNLQSNGRLLSFVFALLNHPHQL